MEPIIFHLVAPYCDLISLASLASVHRVAKNCENDMVREYVYSRYDEGSVVRACILNKIVSAKFVHKLETELETLPAIKIRMLEELDNMFHIPPGLDPRPVFAKGGRFYFESWREVQAVMQSLPIGFMAEWV